jgi:hypothetical protein
MRWVKLMGIDGINGVDEIDGVDDGSKREA